MSFSKLLTNSLLAIAIAVLAAGCASMENQTNVEQAEGSIPWNRPAKWEGPGAMGSMMQGTQ